MTIEWRKIPGASKYEVSNIGHIRSRVGPIPKAIKPRLRGQQLWTTFIKDPVVSSTGHVKEERRWTRVAEVVLEAFVSPAPDSRYRAKHLDGDPSNNRVTNLVWGDAAVSAPDMVKRGPKGLDLRKVKRRAPTDSDRWALVGGLFGLRLGWEVSSHGHVRHEGRLLDLVQMQDGGRVYVRVQGAHMPFADCGMYVPVAPLVAVAFHGMPEPGRPVRLSRQSLSETDLSAANVSWYYADTGLRPYDAPEPELDPLVSQPHKPDPDPDPDPDPAGTVVPPPAPPADDEDDDVVPLGF